MSKKGITKKGSTLLTLATLIFTACNGNFATNVLNSDFNNTYISSLSKYTGVKTGKNLKIKINVPKFSVKAITVPFNQRRMVNEIKSLEVYVIKKSSQPVLGDENTLALGGQPVTINITNPEADSFTLQLDDFDYVGVGLEYWAVVKAYDANDGAGTEITDPNLLSVSSNSAIVDSSLLLTFSPSGNALNVDLKLQNAVAQVGTPTSEISIYSKTGSIPKIESKLDNLGNGLLGWIDGVNALRFMQFKEYIPSPSTFSTNLTNNTDYFSFDLNNKGNGFLVYTDMTADPAKKISGKTINNNVFGSNILIGDVPANKNNFTPHISLNSVGSGLVIWSTDKDGGRNIYGRKVIANIPSDSVDGFQFYRNDSTIKENPRLSLSEKGDGLLVWQEFSSSGLKYDIFGIPVKNFDNQALLGTGTISTSGGLGITGIGTFFTTELQPGSKIVINGNDYVISSITNNNSCSVSNTPPVVSNVNYKIKAGIKKLSGLITTANGSTSVTGDTSTLFLNELVTGQRIKVGTDELIVNTISDNQNLVLLTAPTQSCFSCTYSTKGDFMISKDSNYNSPGPATSQILPNVSVDTSGNGVVFWKDERNFGTDAGSISMRKIINFKPDISEISAADPPDGNTIVIADTNGKVDNSPVGLSLDSKGDGFFTWSDYEAGSRQVFAKRILTYSPVGSIYNIFPTNCSFLPVVNLNYAGSGIISWVQDNGVNSYIYGDHVTSYVPK